MRKRIIELCMVAGVLLVLTVVLWLGRFDLRLAGAVVGPDNIWPGVDSFPWNLLYHWAAVPAFVLAAVALSLLAVGFFRPSYRRFRKDALFVVLLLALGPGLMVNVVLKDHVGRARPRELIEFGGSHHYTELWQPGTTGRNSSFPSGHAAVAFFLIAPWFVYRTRKPRLATAFLLTGTGFGLAVGTARILQGGHFLTDVLWAGGLVYLTGGILALVMDLEHYRK